MNQRSARLLFAEPPTQEEIKQGCTNINAILYDDDDQYSESIKGVAVFAAKLLSCLTIEQLHGQEYEDCEEPETPFTFTYENGHSLHLQKCDFMPDFTVAVVADNRLHIIADIVQIHHYRDALPPQAYGFVSPAYMERLLANLRTESKERGLQ